MADSFPTTTAGSGAAENGHTKIKISTETTNSETYISVQTASRAAPDNVPVAIDADAARTIAAELMTAADALDSQ